MPLSLMVYDIVLAFATGVCFGAGFAAGLTVALFVALGAHIES